MWCNQFCAPLANEIRFLVNNHDKVHVEKTFLNSNLLMIFSYFRVKSKWIHIYKTVRTCHTYVGNAVRLHEISSDILNKANWLTEVCEESRLEMEQNMLSFSHNCVSYLHLCALIHLRIQRWWSSRPVYTRASSCLIWWDISNAKQRVYTKWSIFALYW